MSTMAEIEAAVERLSSEEKELLFRRLQERLRLERQPKRRLPLVAATGHPITQQEIDDALEAD
jgi:hypothetical protein